MTNAIITRLFSYVPDKAIVLGGGDFVRRIKFGNGWSRVRFGMLASVAPDSTRSFLNCSLWFGLSSSTGPPVGSKACENFIGVSFVGQPNTTVRTFTYNAGSGYPYYSGSTGCAFWKANKSRFYTQTAGGNGGVLPPTLTGSRYRRFPLIVDIARNYQGSGGVYTISAYCPTFGIADAYQNDYRPFELLGPNGIDNTGTPTPGNHTQLVVCSAVAVNASEQFGGFDSLNIHWNLSQFPLEIYAVGLSVIDSAPYNDAYGGADEDFESFTVGEQLDDGVMTGIVYGWAGTNVTYGYGNPGPVGVGYYGTLGYPFDTFETYATGTADPYTTFTDGTGWWGNGIVLTQYGTAAAVSGTGAAGTNYSPAIDDFTAYALGAVDPYTTLTAGTNWASYGTTYDGSPGTYSVALSGDDWQWHTIYNYPIAP